ncbi:MAG: radical SAM protein [Chloroflexi bacterium]|nr:radical SAM protein [Chloroflexota bacterium]
MKRNILRCDRPTDTYPISLTGTACALRCAHCNGVYLRHMHSLDDALARGPLNSALVSGGCASSGEVPVSERQFVQLAELRARGTRLNWHVGFAPPESLRHIVPLADAVSFDIIGDRATAREVYGLDKGVEDYLAAYDQLRALVPTVAHITIGLRGGVLSGEYAALQALAERQVDQLVMLVLIPTAETKYADVAPPLINEVLAFIIKARTSLPDARLYLGCMRPSGNYRALLDTAAVHAGVDVIVNSHKDALTQARALGFSIEVATACCILN